jgi:uncharacterized protein (TIGR00369 family)
MSRFEPADADFAARIRDSFDRQGAMSHFGARMTRIEPGEVEIELVYRPELTQQHGFFHGGITGAIADTAGGYAAFTLIPADATMLTVEYKINLIAPADGEKLIAIGRVVKPGRTLTICEMEVAAVKDGAVTVCARGMQTLIRLNGRPDRPGG